MIIGTNQSLSTQHQQYSQFVIEMHRKYGVNPADVSQILQSNKPLYCFNPQHTDPTGVEQLQFGDILNKEKFYQNKQQAELKRRIVEDLAGEIRNWSRRIVEKQKRIIQAESGKYTAKLLQFGSAILGLNSGDSDLDFVCVVPNFIDRKTHFYEGLRDILSSKEGMSNLRVISEAKVPIITFDYRGVPVDISYSQVDYQILPLDIEHNISDEVIASIKEKESVTAILGRKNNQMILAAVQKSDQLDNFKTMLRLLKVWAKKKAIYSNAMGFIGGISLAIMVAKICQLFPLYRVEQLMRQFFYMYSCWDWKIPIMIHTYQDSVQHRHADMRWKKDSREFSMAVLTPAFPQINTTNRVNKTTLQVIQKAFYEGVGKLNHITMEGWSCVFKEMDFFEDHQYFVVIDVLGRVQEKEFMEWFRFVETKLIVLISEFDRIETGNKIQIVPYIKSFKKKIPPKSEYQYCRTFFVGFKITDVAAIQNIDVFFCVRKFILDVSKRTKLSSTGKRKTNLSIYSCRRNEIFDPNDIIWNEDEQDGLKRSGQSLVQPKKMKIKASLMGL